jgi:hypothetical protein
MRQERETATIENAFEFAVQDVYDLYADMEQAAENMPEQLSGAHAHAAVMLDMARSYMNSYDIPEILRDKEVTWWIWTGKFYRPQKRENVVNFLNAYLLEVPISEETEKLRSDLGEAIEILSNVFFPGMRGRRAA